MTKCKNCKREHKADLKTFPPFCCRNPCKNKKGLAMNSNGMVNKEWQDSAYIITTL